MKNKIKPVYSARAQIFTQDEKEHLQVEFLTDMNLYRFSNMCEFMKMDCKKPIQVITDTDAGLTDEEKKKITFCEQDFKEYSNNALRNIIGKYWNGKFFQMYVGNDFQAYEKILPFFCKMIKDREKRQKGLEQTL